MSEVAKPNPEAEAGRAASPASTAHRPQEQAPSRILLVPYPKIIFLYPSLLASLLAGIYMSIFRPPLDPQGTAAVVIAVVFLGVLALNLVILAFDFPRTTSLTLFFFAVAVVMSLVLLFTLKPNLLPEVTHVLTRFRPLANATFYWGITLILGLIFLAVLVDVRFDYWEVRPNELLHHHGFLSNLERLPAPNLRLEKEITDVFEYLLLRSGRLILQFGDNHGTIVLDNVPFIKKKEEAITRLLGALQVQVRPMDRG
jgi:hypothetical protein